MTDNNLITPPPELVEQWYEAIDNSSTSWKQELAAQAARWGADQELEECDKALRKIWQMDHVSTVDDFLRELRAARRPKPASQAEEALILLNDASDRLDAPHENGIRRALERLRELEGNQ